MAERADAAARTREPTARRLADARRRGEVACSRELTAAAALVGVFLVLVTSAPAGVARWLGYLSRVLASPAATAPTAALTLAAGELALLLAPPLGGALAFTLVVGAGQTGGLFTLGAVRLRTPAWRWRASGASALKGGALLLLVGALAWLTLRSFLGPLVALAGARAPTVLTGLGRLSEVLGTRLAAAALALGLADYLWQRHRHRQSLRMTHEEVRRETRETEGDPLLRAERQRLHREAARQPGLPAVRKADFVVVGPGSATAIRYQRGGAAAPVVLARGERLLATRIEEVARDAGVPIFADMALARSLRALPEGAEIPAALYQPVAEILRIVYGEAGR